MTPRERTFTAERMPADPLPWLTPRFTTTGCFDKDASGALTPRAQDALLGTLQSIVSGLHDDDRPYRVVFANVATAATSFKARQVVVGTKPVHDENLTDGQRAAVLLGEVYHEVVHIRYTRNLVKAIETTFTGDALAMRMSNIAEDIRGESLIVRDMPGYADSLITTLWWVGHRGRRLVSDPDTSTVAARAEEATAIVRFPWLRDWAAHGPALREWAEWWRGWAERAALAHTAPKHVAVIREALDMLRDGGDPMPVKPEPEPEPEPEGEPEPDGEGEGEPDPDYIDDTRPPEVDPDKEPEAPQWQPDPEDESEPEGEDDPGNDGDDPTDDDDGDTDDGDGSDADDGDGDGPEGDEPDDDADPDGGGTGKGAATDGDTDADADTDDGEDDGDDGDEPTETGHIDNEGIDGNIPDACPLALTVDEHDADYQAGADARTKARAGSGGDRTYTYQGRGYTVRRQTPSTLGNPGSGNWVPRGHPVRPTPR